MRSTQALQEKRLPPIRVVNRETSKRTFDDSPRIPPYGTSPGVYWQEMSHINNPQTPTSTFSSRTSSPWESSNPGTHNAPQLLLDNSSISGYISKRGRREDNIDLHVSIPLDDDYDSDFTPPVTPRMPRVPDRARIASVRSHEDSATLQVPPSPHSQVNKLSKPVQIPGFDLHLPIPKVPKALHPCSQPDQSRPVYKQELTTPSLHSQPPPSLLRSAFSDDFSVDLSNKSSEVERLPVPVEYTQLESPNFTDPFARNEPLEPLTRLTEKDYRPLSREALNPISKVQPGREQSNVNDSYAVLTRTSIKVTERKTLQSEKPWISPIRPGSTSQMELSSHDKSGMSSTGERMLRLMKEAFSDVSSRGLKKARSRQDLQDRRVVSSGGTVIDFL